jgi:hypothetical protein
MRSPILFLVFNRPEATQQVFDVIRKSRPSKLYLAADGPRKDKLDEAVRCQVVQEIISNVDWPCEVSRLIRKENLGCKIAVSSALDWFFSCESEGIILEDDCLPHADFFTYCDELLEKYRHDERIGLISGTAYGDLREKKLISGPEDFIFNRYPSIWGWASWRRVWKDYDVKIKKWGKYRQDISPLTVNLKLRKKNDWLFDQVSNSKIDTWDYQVSFLLWSTARMAITPRFNLIENIGFGADATHTKQSYQIDASRIQMSRERLKFPLVEPKVFSPNYVYQVWLERYATRSILFKLINRIKNYVIQ